MLPILLEILCLLTVLLERHPLSSDLLTLDDNFVTPECLSYGVSVNDGAPALCRQY